MEEKIKLDEAIQGTSNPETLSNLEKELAEGKAQ